MTTSTIESWVGTVSLLKVALEDVFRKLGGGEAVEAKDAILIMLSFGVFIFALLTYISQNYRRK